MANGSPSGVQVPDARSPNPSSTSSGAAQKGQQEHKTVRYRRCVCGGRVQGQRLESRLSTAFHAPRRPGRLDVLVGGVLDGHRQQDEPASVPLLTPHAGGGLAPPPLWVVHGKSTFDRACKAVCRRAEWAIALLLSTGPAPDADASLVLEEVTLDKVPHDLHTLSPRFAKMGQWSTERWWFTCRTGPQPCRGPSIPPCWTPSSQYADARYTGSYIEYIGQKLSSLPS